MKEYAFRPATPDDLAALTTLVAEAEMVDYGEVTSTSEDIENDWHRPRLDIARDTWVAFEPGGAAVAYGFVWGREEHRYIVSVGLVHPEHRGRGIGARLLAAMEERARGLIAEAPADVSPLLTTVVPANDTAGLRLAERAGYRESRRFWRMDRDIAPGIIVADDPPGVVIGRADHDADSATMHEVIQDAFRDHWRPRYEPFSEWQERNLRKGDELYWFLARDQDEPVAALTGYLFEGARSHVDQIGVRPAWRRRGIAERLLLRAFAAFADAGATHVDLDVDSANPTGATALYERVGMYSTISYVFLDKPLR